ncbi:hypothetical protein D3C81_893640 [compost metagenome]
MLFVQATDYLAAACKWINIHRGLWIGDMLQSGIIRSSGDDDGNLICSGNRYAAVGIDKFTAFKDYFCNCGKLCSALIGVSRLANLPLK